ncbi:NosD domain-containing protein, partial [Paenarthrobacter ureafaciens]
GLGITLVRMENFNVHDNVIKSAGAQGITLSNCAGKGRIANNTVAGSGLTGIQTIGDQPSLDIHVLNNFVEASTASGITVENVRSLSLQGNTVKDVVDGGASGQRGFRIGGSTSGISTGQVKNNTAIGTFASGAYSLIGIGIATAFEDGNSWNFQKGYGSAAPASGTWARGSTIWNTAPAASGAVGWICVTAGTPGTWKTFGNIAA